MTKCASGFALFALATGLMIACGGSAVSVGNPSDGAGGTSGSSAVGGGGSGTIASAGSISTAGGSGSDTCFLPKQPGNCEAYEPSFWHNPETGVCEPFVYGGCGGNANRFATRDDCIAACPGGGSNWGACKVDAGCAQFVPGCCGACEPVDGNALLAVSTGHLSELMKAQDQQCGSFGVCAPCPTVGEYEATGKYFEPVCVSGQCSLRDIRKSALTACKTDSDCELRDGTNCCPGCDSMGFVAVNSNAAFCSDGPVPCDPCGPILQPPAGLSASCQQGYCALALPTRGTPDLGQAGAAGASSSDSPGWSCSTTTAQCQCVKGPSSNSVVCAGSSATCCSLVGDSCNCRVAGEPAPPCGALEPPQNLVATCPP